MSATAFMRKAGTGSLPSGPVFSTHHADQPSLEEMRADAEHCTRCDLYKNATHLVFGEGPRDARVVLVGEQPGDQEDIAARPFIGPAGRILNECLHEAGIDRSALYLTNSVKHFKFEPRGKRRIHAKPNVGEIKRCAWWLGGELDLIRPKLVVALGATALFALTGNSVKVTQARGEIIERLGMQPLLVTIHPSSLLRMPDREDAKRSRERFIEELRRIGDYLGEQ